MMANKEELHDLRTSHAQTRPSKAEVSQMLREAKQQYKEYMRIADLADITERTEVKTPRYSWDNPIGLVATG